MATVADLLARKPAVVWSIHPDEPVLAAIQMMADRNVGALCVLKGDELVGIISERDYARKVVLRGRSSAETMVWEIMSAPVVAVAPKDAVRTCQLIMTERKFRHLPVVDQGKLVGMLSIGDLVRQVIEEQQIEIEQLQRYIAS